MTERPEGGKRGWGGVRLTRCCAGRMRYDWLTPEASSPDEVLSDGSGSSEQVNCLPSVRRKSGRGGSRTRRDGPGVRRFAPFRACDSSARLPSELRSWLAVWRGHATRCSPVARHRTEGAGVEPREACKAATGTARWHSTTELPFLVRQFGPDRLRYELPERLHSECESRTPINVPTPICPGRGRERTRSARRRSRCRSPRWSRSPRPRRSSRERLRWKRR